jgi:hypothetical protein
VTAFWVVSRSIGRHAAVGVCILGLSLAGTAAGQAPTGTRVNPTAADLAEFQKRLDAYMTLHDKAASGLNTPGKEATPEEIVTYQRQLEARLVPLRTSAKAGDIFSPEMQAFIRKYLAQLFSGPQGANLKGVVMDENPVDVKFGVNTRYPDTVPLSTMPAQVLEVLPKLPEGLEYRFIGRDLILMDVRAHTIVDFVRDAIPA